MLLGANLIHAGMLTSKAEQGVRLLLLVTTVRTAGTLLTQTAACRDDVNPWQPVMYSPSSAAPQVLISASTGKMQSPTYSQGLKHALIFRLNHQKRPASTGSTQDTNSPPGLRA